MLQAILYEAAIASAPAQPQSLLVGLHGWGANAQDLAALAPMLHLPDYRMVFPNAPFQHPYSIEGRMWYELPNNYSFLGSEQFRNQPDLISSRQQLTEWLRSLAGQTGIPLDRTILVGFSQGGAMTLDVGSTLPLKALIVLSGYMHAPIAAIHPDIQKILMVHGTQDQVVLLAAAHRSRDHLLALNAPLQYHELAMGHEIRLSILEIMQNFIEGIASHPQETA